MSPGAGGISPGSVLVAGREVLRARHERPLVLVGPEGLVGVLRRELVRGGVESAVRAGGPVAGAAAVVAVVAGTAREEDAQALREAERQRVPAVAVLLVPPGAASGDPPDPAYVPAANVVRVRSGEGFPMERVGRTLARALRDRGPALAARLPVLRDAVVDELVRRYSKTNGIVGVAVWVPGADMPVLTVNQIRLLLRIADAYGFEIDRERVPEVLGVVAGGFGFRGVARSALGLVPLAGWVVKGGIAYAGTKAVGEAARRYFEARAPVTRTASSRSRFPR